VDAVERAHTKSLDANDKLMQIRSHVRDKIASRKRQVIMRKGKSAILISRKFNISCKLDILRNLTKYLSESVALKSKLKFCHTVPSPRRGFGWLSSPKQSSKLRRIVI